MDKSKIEQAQKRIENGDLQQYDGESPPLNVQTIDNSQDNVKRCIERSGFMRSKSPDNYDKAFIALSSVLRHTNRGLIVSGPVGSGKTLLMRSVALLVDNPKLVKCFDVQDLARLTEVEQVGDSDNKTLVVSKQYTAGGLNVILDDMGSEQELNDFGRKFNVITCFIMEFYASWQRGYAGRLFITTNFTDKQLYGEYEVRIMDRLMDMCDYVRFEGTSNRRTWERY